MKTDALLDPLAAENSEYQAPDFSTATSFADWLALREVEAHHQPTSSPGCTWKCGAYGHSDDCLQSAWSGGSALASAAGTERIAHLEKQRDELQEANTREVLRRRELESEIARRDAAPPMVVDLDRLKRQRTVSEWCARAFGAGPASSIPQRAVRLLEECVEAYQAAGADAEMAHRLIDFVFARPAGNLAQEIGGIGVTVLALAEAANLDAEVEEVREIRRVMSKPLEHFAERNAAKNAAGFEVAAREVQG